jgi:drug/metabolite transporter (DMT)-like permease
VPTTLASTYSYANPIVALIIGIGWLHEAFNWHLVIGGAVIVIGVALMIAAPKPVYP